MMGKWSSWILAARVKTLPAALAPIVVGGAVAEAAGGAVLGPLLLAATGALWLQIGANFANDVFDFEKGADTEARKGPTRAVHAGLLSARQMRRGMLAAFGLATLCGAALIAIAGWPVLIIGVASIAAGIAYTGGPYPLGYNGLGDIFVFIFFGLVAVVGTVYVQLLAIPTLAWWASIPVGALATAILVVNNIRDADEDVGTGKRTLAVRFGRPAARVEYLVLVLGSYLVPLWIAVRESQWWYLLPLCTAPVAVHLIRTIWCYTDGPVLNRALARTAAVLLAHSILMATGFLMGAS